MNINDGQQQSKFTVDNAERFGGNYNEPEFWKKLERQKKRG